MLSKELYFTISFGSMAKAYIYGSENHQVSPSPNKLSGDDKTATLLDHQFNAVTVIILVAFIALSILMGIDHHFSSTPVCNERVILKDWVTNAMAMAVGGAVLTCTLQIIRVSSLLCLKSKTQNTPVVRVNIMLFLLCSLSGLSKTLTLLKLHGGICQDAFGVYSPAHQWVEWMVFVPFLNYIACAVEQKTQMDWFDIVMVALHALMILTGFLLNMRIPFGLAVFLLVLSFLSLLIITVMTIVNYQHVTAHAPVKVRMNNYFSAKQTRRKAGLLLQLLIIMWYYPVVWILSAAQVLDINFTFAAYSIGSIFGKVIFSSLVIEPNFTLLYEYLITTASNANLGEDRLVDLTAPRSSSDGRPTKVIVVRPVANRYLATAKDVGTAGQIDTMVGTIATISEGALELV